MYPYSAIRARSLYAQPCQPKNIRETGKHVSSVLARLGNQKRNRLNARRGLEITSSCPTELLSGHQPENAAALPNSNLPTIYPVMERSRNGSVDLSVSKLNKWRESRYMSWQVRGSVSSQLLTALRLQIALCPDPPRVPGWLLRATRWPLLETASPDAESGRIGFGSTANK